MEQKKTRKSAYRQEKKHRKSCHMIKTDKEKSMIDEWKLCSLEIKYLKPENLD